MAIRGAYAEAGITDFNKTTYLECHGTGTQAGDPIEVNGVGMVFAETRPADSPLLIGSVSATLTPERRSPELMFQRVGQSQHRPFRALCWYLGTDQDHLVSGKWLHSGHAVIYQS